MDKLYLVKVSLRGDDSIILGHIPDKGPILKFLVQGRFSDLTSKRAMEKVLSTIDENNFEVVSITAGRLLFDGNVTRMPE